MQSCNFGRRSYLWFQIKLALRARSILKARVWFQPKLHSTQFNYHYKLHSTQFNYHYVQNCYEIRSYSGILTGRRVNYYTPTKERKTDVVLSQVLEGRVIQTLSILKGKNRGTAYIYMYMYMCVCINIYIYIYIYTTRIYCKKSCPYSSEWNTPGYQSGPQSGVQILARGTCLRFFYFF